MAGLATQVSRAWALSTNFTLEEGAAAIAAMPGEVGSGRETAAERLGCLATNISRFGSGPI